MTRDPYIWITRGTGNFNPIQLQTFLQNHPEYCADLVLGIYGRVDSRADRCSVACGGRFRGGVAGLVSRPVVGPVCPGVGCNIDAMGRAREGALSGELRPLAPGGAAPPEAIVLEALLALDL